eukprot:116218_1
MQTMKQQMQTNDRQTKQQIICFWSVTLTYTAPSRTKTRAKLLPAISTQRNTSTKHRTSTKHIQDPLGYTNIHIQHQFVSKHEQNYYQQYQRKETHLQNIEHQPNISKILWVIPTSIYSTNSYQNTSKII